VRNFEKFYLRKRDSMVIKVVVDNNTYIDQYFCGEPAVSFYIEDEDRKILFDVGYSDLYLENMKKLDIDIDEINTIVLSHGHNDHTKGLTYLFDKYNGDSLELVGHPQVLNPKKYDDEFIGSPMSKEELVNSCEIHLTKAPLRISNNMIFLGEIPQKVHHEKRKAIGRVLVEGKYVDDYLIDDSAIVYQGKDGIYIITGCSHSGICNIIEYAKEVTGCNKVIGILGGLHLFELDDIAISTIDYIAECGIQELYPCHCTSFKVKSEMNKYVEVNEVGVGLVLNWK
jgi:7,8-dihydropterin-6-yl-methyl-4-(beta-D-ribofuranosyl)aminobenzene 5'-phosphate synthase